MALDGIFLRHICNEIAQFAIGARVDKIYQPNKEELVFSLRSHSGAKKLLLSIRSNSPRIHFTENAPENPQTPPMLCMLLRKKLTGAKITDIRQEKLERMMIIDFDAINELGDIVKISVVTEIMGKYSNVILLDEKGKIIDALKRVDPSMSTQRLILPGLDYELPPAQDKLCLLDSTAEQVIERIINKAMPLSKALLSSIQGVSPIICRELEYLTGRGDELFSDRLSPSHIERLKYFLRELKAVTEKCSGNAYTVCELSGKPFDYSFMNICQYTTMAQVKRFESFSEMLDSFYSERDQMERMRVKSQDLLKLLTNTSDRLSRKINTQKMELAQCADRETLRQYGDLLQANLYRIERGSGSVTVENFYSENMEEITIKLNPALSPAQNAQKYYKDYNKAKNAENILKVQIEKAQKELEYIDTVFDSLSRASVERELAEIREELIDQGYLKIKGARKKLQGTLKPLEFTSPTGFKILVGRNNRQNDNLTLRQADKNDIWFHTKNIPGSHTVLITDGKTPDEQSMVMAAQLAAYHSKAKNSSQVPVDYTLIRYVSKPQGAKPGMVIFVNNKTLFVTPGLGEQ